MRLRRLSALLLAGLLVGACSSDGDAPKAKPGVLQQEVTNGDLRLDVLGADSISPARATGPLDEGTRAGVVRTLQRTFDATVVRPARGRRIGDLASLFTADALARATGPDRPTLLDEGVPRSGTLVADRAEVRLRALTDDRDQPALVVARIDWDVRSSNRRVRIQRGGELTLVPVLGTWVIGGYTVVTSRTVDGATTTTTAATP